MLLPSFSSPPSPSPWVIFSFSETRRVVFVFLTRLTNTHLISHEYYSIRQCANFYIKCYSSRVANKWLPPSRSLLETHMQKQDDYNEVLQVLEWKDCQGWEMSRLSSQRDLSNPTTRDLFHSPIISYVIYYVCLPDYSVYYPSLFIISL